MSIDCLILPFNQRINSGGIMEYQSFLREIKEYFCNYFPPDSQVRIQQIVKNNNLVLDALTILEQGKNVAPTIYLNPFYEAFAQEKITFSEVCDSILDLHFTNRPIENIRPDFFTDFRSVQSRIIFKLINYKANAQLLSSIPHIPYLDLAICFCCYYETLEHQHATILIRNEHLKMWNTSQEVLYELASQNTPHLLPVKQRKFKDVVEGYIGDSSDFSDIPDLYILTNRALFLGASSMIYHNLLHELSNTIQNSFYILPSSIHEGATC